MIYLSNDTFKRSVSIPRANKNHGVLAIEAFIIFHSFKIMVMRKIRNYHQLEADEWPPDDETTVNRIDESKSGHKTGKLDFKLLA